MRHFRGDKLSLGLNAGIHRLGEACARGIFITAFCVAASYHTRLTAMPSPALVPEFVHMGYLLFHFASLVKYKEDEPTATPERQKKNSSACPLSPGDENFHFRILDHFPHLNKYTTDASSGSSSGSSQHPGGTHYWYGEHETNSSRSSVSEYWGNGDEFAGWTGGVGACSTDDFVDWRYVVRYACTMLWRIIQRHEVKDINRDNVFEGEAGPGEW